MDNNYDHILNEFATRLHSFISKRVSNPHDAEDLLQEVYYKIYRNISGLIDVGKLHAWVFQLARNAILDYYRTGRREDPFAKLPEPEAVRADENDNLEIANCLKGMINQLPHKEREAIKLTKYKGLTQKELGQLLGLSHSGAKSRVQRAQHRLKKMLCECCSLEFDCRGNIIDYKLKAKANPFCDLK